VVRVKKCYVMIIQSCESEWLVWTNEISRTGDVSAMVDRKKLQGVYSGQIHYTSFFCILHTGNFLLLT